MTTDPIAQALADALEQERAGDPAAALETFDKAIKELSESVLLNSNRGLLLERMGRYEEALLAFQAAAHVENNFRDHYNAGNMLLFLERYDEAIESFQSSIACRDDYAEAWVNQGIALHALSRHAEARQAFDKALSIDSSFYPALRSFAILEASIGNDSAAIEYYEKAAAAQPEHVSAWFELGCALYKSLGEGQIFFEREGPEGKTIQALDKVIELDPSKQGAWGRKIGVLFRLVDGAHATDHAAAEAKTETISIFPIIHSELVSTIEAACIQFPEETWFAKSKNDAIAKTIK